MLRSDHRLFNTQKSSLWLRYLDSLSNLWDLEDVVLRSFMSIDPLVVMVNLVVEGHSV